MHQKIYDTKIGKTETEFNLQEFIANSEILKIKNHIFLAICAFHTEKPSEHEILMI